MASYKLLPIYMSSVSVITKCTCTYVDRALLNPTKLSELASQIDSKQVLDEDVQDVRVCVCE